MDLLKALDIDEREYILEMLDHPAYKALVTKLLPQLLQKHADKVTSIRPDTSEDVHKLLVAQANYQGARAIIEDMKQLKQSLRNQRTK